MPRESYDVIVVGGGVHGCSLAYRLAVRKKRVLLVEQRDICSGASGRNGGITGEGSSLFAGAGDAVYALTSENLRMMSTIGDELGIDFQLTRPGGLDVATTEAQWNHLQQAVPVQRAAGLDVHLLDAHEARKLEPALAPDIIGAKFARGHGHLWPFGLVHGLAGAAAKLGAEIRTNTTVLNLLRRGERVTGVSTSAGSFEAENVVLATNSYTPLLLPELPAGSIVPARGQILVTQPVAPMLRHAFGTNFDKEYGRQVPGGPILCGGFRRLDEDEGLGHYEERVTLPVISGIASCLTQLYPALKEIQVVRCWAGIMGFTPDGMPLIGPMDGMPGLTLSAGFNGGGFSWALVTGKTLAAQLCGDTVPFDLSPFRPGRFAEKGTAWNNPFTAGEASRARAGHEV
jgi:sarcosine oxidase subunit beta